MTTETDRIAQVWPGWKTEELIGRGAFGSVYRASRTVAGLTMQAAVKVIDIPSDDYEVNELRSMGMDNRSIRSYFEETAHSIVSEIAVMNRLKGSPHIVNVEDFQLKERPDGVGWSIFIRMELLESLAVHQRRSGIPDQHEVARMGAQLCDALASCHAEGIIHRDVKPDNVFVTKYGDYKLGDFGIAKNLDNATRSTKSFAGTRPYMAPEVEGGRYDESVDTYSLGLMLYRWLNGGRPPFLPATGVVGQADLQAAQARRLAGERPPLPAGPDVDPTLASVVTMACEPDPANRWRSAAEFGRTLERWLDEHPAPASNPTVGDAGGTPIPESVPLPHGAGFEDLLTSSQTINFNAWVGQNAAHADEPTEVARRGDDVSLTVSVPAEVAGMGGVVEVGYQAGGASRHLQMRIPAGTLDGAVLRATGCGCPGTGGAAAGDLLATVSVTAPVAAQTPIQPAKERRLSDVTSTRIVAALAAVAVLARAYFTFAIMGEIIPTQIILLLCDIVIAVLAFWPSKGLEKALAVILCIDSVVSMVSSSYAIATTFSSVTDTESLGFAVGFFIGIMLLPFIEAVAAFVLLGPRHLKKPVAKVVAVCTVVASVVWAISALQAVSISASSPVLYLAASAHCAALALYCWVRARQDGTDDKAAAMPRMR